MKVKKIVFTAPKETKVLDGEIAELSRFGSGENQILVRMAYTTISNGTEKANLIGDKNVYGLNPPPPDDKLFPRHKGYSGAGVVIETGKNVKKVKVGDRVALAGGLHQSYCIYHEDQVERVPDNVSLSEASMSFISIFPLAAIRKVKLEIGETAIVMGMGILGAFAVKLLRAAGAAVVVAADPVHSRRELALKLGADYAFNPFDADFSEKVKEVTGGGANVAIEVTGVGKALDQVLDCMTKYGRVALLGCTRSSDFTIDYYKKVHCPGVTLIGAHTMARPDVESSANYWTTADDMKAVLRLIGNKRMTVTDMISEIHEITDAPEVFTRLADDKDFPIGVQFKWSDDE